MTSQSTHYVYRIYKDERLLYVGMTSNLRKRMMDHACKHWWPVKPVIKITEKSSEWEAREYERDLIRQFVPPENIQLSTIRSKVESFGFLDIDPLIPVSHAIDLYGTQHALAMALHVSKGAVSQWKLQGYVPPLHAHRLCAMHPSIKERFSRVKKAA